MILLSQVKENNSVGRIDSEYFCKENMRLLRLLQAKPVDSIGSRAFVTDGIHASIPYIEGSRIRVISAKHPKDNYFDLNNCEEISAEYHAANPRTMLRVGDVILSTVGTIGNAAVVTAEMLPANSDRHVGIIRPEKDLPAEFLATFLVGRFGRFQTVRETTGNVQPNLFISKIKELLAPRFPTDFMDAIVDRVRSAHQKHQLSIHLLSDAERHLLSALGLDTWRPPEPLTYTRRAADVFAAGRMDAEHYQERYYALDGLLKSYHAGTVLLGDICPVPVNGVEIREYHETGVPYLRVGDLKFYDLQQDSVVRVNATEAETLISKVALRVGDVLVSRSGSLGVTGVVKEKWADALISSHLIRLRIENPEIDPYYLAVFLATYPGRSQINQKSNGGVQPEINQPSLKSIVVPKLDREVQRMIRKSVEESHSARNQATALLARAKRAVEIAIEESEAAALAYLDEEEN